MKWLDTPERRANFMRTINPEKPLTKSDIELEVIEALVELSPNYTASESTLCRVVTGAVVKRLARHMFTRYMLAFEPLIRRRDCMSSVDYNQALKDLVTKVQDELDKA